MAKKAMKAMKKAMRTRAMSKAAACESRKCEMMKVLGKLPELIYEGIESYGKCKVPGVPGVPPKIVRLVTVGTACAD
jgi:hypothetical protein